MEVVMTNIMRKENRANGRTTPSFSGILDQVFENNLSRYFDDSFWGFNSDQGLTGSSVPVNVKETDKSYEMEVAAPGLRKEDFKIAVNGDMLTVSFERKEENNQENENEGWLRREFRAQSFSRSFNLDDSVDMNKITAKYNDGILHLSLPKKEGAQRINRTIEIK
jgi:HSP20 family protein